MIKFKDIDLKFDNNYVLNKFNMVIKENEKILITGKSGIGKTSLFNLLLGFIQPENGNVYYKNKHIDQNYIWEVRKEIAYISQDVNIGRGNVYELMKFYFNLKHNGDLKITKNDIINLMNVFLLGEDILKKDIESLSGGEKQRVAIIISILLNRKVFLLDEITSALDKKLKSIVSRFFLKNKEYTLLIISHDDVWNRSKKIKKYNMEKKEWAQ